jgi:basic membrane protein A
MKALRGLVCILVILMPLVAACEKVPPPAEQTPAATPPPAAEKYKIPEPVAGKFNAAFVYVGPVGDGGWSYSHDQGRQYLAKTLPDVATTFIESVAEGAEAEQVIRSLARKKFDLIVATSFGFMDACEAVAKEFPAVKFLHVSGFKKNDTNFGNLFGAMEDMKYLAGMIAGARAKADKIPKLGYIAPLPIPEVIRLINAVALGMKSTCSECTLEVRWVNSWFDPVKEKEAAESLLAAGAQVVLTGNDTSGPIVAAGKAGKWSVGYNSDNACHADKEHCLTVPYWNWGASYVRLVTAIKAGTWKPADDYPTLKDDAVGLLGFMEGQQLAPGVPAAVVPKVKEKLAAMSDGKFGRFEIFKAPLKDNKGRVVLPAGQALTQEDLEGLTGVTGRPDCKVCMNYFVDGIVGEIPK